MGAHEARARDVHEGWLVRALLGRTFGQLHGALSHGVVSIRTARRTTDYPTYEDGVRGLIYMAVTVRGIIGALGALPFVLALVTDPWGAWLTEVGLGVVWLAALGGLVCVVRLALLRLTRGRPTRWSEPWSWDLLWQAVVVVALVAVLPSP